MVETGTDKQGDISEWNEGNFKSMRLHQAQVLINNSKINPLSYDRLINKWGYQLWFNGVDIMFGEGQQKYGTKEFDDCIKLKKQIEKLMENPICFNITNHLGKGVSVKMNEWKELKETLEEFEYLVKSYNDKHGFSTKNVGTKGLF